MKIIKANSDVVDQHPAIVSEILKVLGHPEAMVTDKSYISDFTDFGKNPTTEMYKKLHLLNGHFGINLTKNVSFLILIQMILDHRKPTTIQ